MLMGPHVIVVLVISSTPSGYRGPVGVCLLPCVVWHMILLRIRRNSTSRQSCPWPRYHRGTPSLKVGRISIIHGCTLYVHMLQISITMSSLCIQDAFVG